VERIPVFEPEIDEDDVQAVADTVRRGEISGAFGQSVPAFERAFADYCGVKHGVAVSSGTTALHLSVAAARIGPRDEVLVSASTNIATALAAYHCGAIPVPVDSEPETWNLNLQLIEDLITERTKAIIPVHLFGHPVDMDALNEIARRHDLLEIEDAAEAHGAQVRGRRCGSLGDLNCFSFFANKVITTGEGGMVLTDDDELADRLRYLRNLAHGERRFLHLEAGFNFRMTGYQAALGLSQIRKIDRVVDAKRRIAARYNELLADVPGIQTPVERDWARNVYWMYAIVLDENYPLRRDELIAALEHEGIDSRTFFCPMNQQPFLRDQPNFRDVRCPVADRLWETGLYLPSAPSLTNAQIERVAACISAPVPV
jgi:perosamine synthetase